MHKRLNLALFLSLLVWLGWLTFFAAPPERPVETPPEAVGAAPSTGPGPGTDASDVPVSSFTPTSTVVEADKEERKTLILGRPGEPGYYQATFTNVGGRLVELRLGGEFDAIRLDKSERSDPEHWARLVTEADSGLGTTGSLGLSTSASSAALTHVPLEEALWQMSVLGSEESPQGVEFTYAPGTGIVFKKRILTEAGKDRLLVELEIQNENAATAVGPKQFLFTPAAVVPRDSEDNFYVEPKAIAVARDGDGDAQLEEVQRDEGAGPDDRHGSFKLGERQLRFVGAHNKYFAFLLRGADELSERSMIGARWRRVMDQTWVDENPGRPDKAYKYVVADVDLRLAVPQVGQTSTYRYIAYAGPKARQVLIDDYELHSELVEKDLGFFSAIAKILLFVLGGYHGLTGNWGVAIILLTISVRLLLFPINRRSQTAMARYQTKMKRLQPRIDEIKKKYEKDSQKQRQEQAKLMQEEGAFPPLGGCLPIFVQIPVFIGLFQALRTNFDLRHAPFAGWINDLSMPDRLMRIDFNTHLPFLGTIEYLNILPPLMVVFWILQQRGMPKPADEQAARMQKMMLWMPVMMGFFLYNYAAGLSLYMITQSLLGILEIKVIKKYWPVDDTEMEKKKSGFLARLAEAQKTQMKKVEAAQRAKGGGGKQRGGGSKRKGR